MTGHYLTLSTSFVTISKEMTDPHDILSQVIKQQAPELLNYSNEILLTMGGKKLLF